MALRLRRGTDAQRTASGGIVFAEGELIYVTDTKKLWVGDGITPGGVAVDTAGNAGTISIGDLTDVDVDSITPSAGNVLAWSGTKWQPTTVSAAGNGIVEGSNYRISVAGDDSTILVDSSTSKINLDGTVKGNIIPDQDQVYDLGGPLNRFRDLYLSGSSINFPGGTISESNGNFVIPGITEGNYKPINTRNIGTGPGAIFGDVPAIIDQATYLMATTGPNYTLPPENYVIPQYQAVMSNGTNGEIVDIIIVDQGSFYPVGAGFDSVNTDNMIAFPEGTDVSTLSNVIAALGTEIGAIDWNVNSGVVSTKLTGQFYGSVVGDVQGSTNGYHTGDVTGSVFSLDSTMMIDAFAGKITGDIISSSITGADIYASDGVKVYEDASKTFAAGGIDLLPGSVINGDRLTIGTTQTLTFRNGAPDPGNPWVTYASYNNTNADAESIVFLRTRGNIFSPTAVQNNDYIINLALSPYDGVNYLEGGAITGIALENTGTYTTKWVLSVRDSNAAVAEVLELSENSVKAVKPLELPVYADATARDTAITAPTVGMMVVTGTTFTGYNGTAWVNLS